MTGLVLALPAMGMVAGAALADPISVAAQTITPAELVGTWVQAQWRFSQPDNQYVRADSPYLREIIWTFNADSTWAVQVRRNGVEIKDTEDFWLARWPGRWELRGDTLVAIADSAGKKRDFSWGKVARTGDQLVWAGGRFGSSDCANLFRRADASKLLPPPATTPPPSTVSPAALAGTWVRTGEKSVASPAWADTLTLGADKTARHVHYTGEWELLPGDYLGVTLRDPPRKVTDFQVLKVATMRGQVVIALHEECLGVPSAVYKRVSP